MTAIVGILNRHGVALAADSAVTINTSQGHKVINSATKIFTLSKVHPVGIMIYNNASLMGTPWDVIIKYYRDIKKNEVKPKISDYAHSFVDFILQQKCFCSDKLKEKYLEKFIIDEYDRIEIKQIEHIGSKIDDKNKSILLQRIKDCLSSLNIPNDDEICEGLTDFKKDEFLNYTDHIFKSLYENRLEKNGCDLELLEKFKDYVYNLILRKDSRLPFSGLVFTGYGNDELFPSIYSVNVYFPIGNRLRYTVVLNNSIGEESSGAIFPFAQTDVMHTVLSGVNPEILTLVNEIFRKYVIGYNNILNKEVNDPKIAAAIKTIDFEGIFDGFSKTINEEIKKNYIKPLVDTVEYLEKEDMAEMAESLVSLTYLKRRMTSSEESVGGPVDVAIISKSDGFVWIKRKLYFPGEINHQFFTNYFK